MARIEGTPGNDNGTDNPALVGTRRDDDIFGLAGNDRLLGRQGDDFLFGGAGRDFLAGGPGADVLFGDPGPASGSQTFSDRFYFESGLIGYDIVRDFEVEKDVIDLEGFEGSSFDVFMANSRQRGNDVLFKVRDVDENGDPVVERILLLNVDRATLAEGNFL